MRCACVQIDQEELSRCLFAFFRLAYKPSRLLNAIDASLPHSAHILANVHCAVKVAQCIAAFQMDLPRLHAWTMKILSQLDASQFPASLLMSQAVIAHRLGRYRGCGPSMPHALVNLGRSRVPGCADTGACMQVPSVRASSVYGFGVRGSTDDADSQTQEPSLHCQHLNVSRSNAAGDGAHEHSCPW